MGERFQVQQPAATPGTVLGTVLGRSSFLAQTFSVPGRSTSSAIGKEQYWNSIGTQLFSVANIQRAWALDQLGNWEGTFSDLFRQNSEQERTHDAVNELTGFTTPANFVDPAYDLAGNITTMPQPADQTASFTLTYDAWNRLVVVEDTSGTVAQYEYDGQGRRIVKDIPGGTTDDVDYYYNDRWQLLTEVKDGSVEAIYQWHPNYIDALNLRMRSSDMHWFLHDANFNVTAAMDDSTGAVVERYAYTPYGEVTVLDPDYSADADGISDIGNTHFYTGRERDPETGLQLNRNRYYAPHLGRWLTRDPIGYEGRSSNLYDYVRSSPIGWVDPQGLQYIQLYPCMFPEDCDGRIDTMPPPCPDPPLKIGSPGQWGSGPPGRPGGSKGNCWRYACNDPGKPGEPHQAFPGGEDPQGHLTCSQLRNLAKKTRGVRDTDKDGKCPKCYYKVKLVLQDNPGFNDYHWYRQDDDGTWSHKPGMGPVQGPINDPTKDAKKRGYPDDCGYLCVKKGTDVD